MLTIIIYKSFVLCYLYRYPKTPATNIFLEDILKVAAQRAWSHLRQRGHRGRGLKLGHPPGHARTLTNQAGPSLARG